MEFGDYEVNITVPSDHIVEATGSLLNPKDVLNKEEYKRFIASENNFEEPILIVNQEEAIAKESLFSNIDKLNEKAYEISEQTLNEILPKAFAVVKETARRFVENKEIPNLSKWILSFGMLLGRLELFAVLVLFFPMLPPLY